jgi:hypothetical protein
MPHSKLKSLTEPARLGPKTAIMASVKATKAAATPNCIKIGKKSNAVYVGFIKKGCFVKHKGKAKLCNNAPFG